MNTSADFTINDIQEGMGFSFTVTITTEMINSFAALSGDENPLHMDENFAREHGFAGRVVHGAMLTAFISRLIGMYCPGRRALWHSLNLKYHHPSYSGDELIIAGVVDQISESVQTMLLKLTVTNKATQAVNASGKAQIGFLE